ncbi:hypothetical protein [Cellulomonas fimi]|uniref:Uncharacterized protein n=1 Tax=Cellulomonas fimi (strain ATCC 484 / DSM 20113 / JCM 1341 / CCUG 24087 / LMG 16345 / NBRC 15513 / NCIMB 8980 / NCTC 7547 / NRS-133) TaxID=590998 RepID=F4GYP5_CELFA|nr:hypothetical protein [Cellulomonas fimi]AEE44764.1 hypothetical protein Celf_0624 [Cellulomonas fimi ATCC 484]NNH06095.1 hypothetical protein [Cellulomonas fimi]VEH27229.1 Uncharacterised protein [Cellulomonas fimi]
MLDQSIGLLLARDASVLESQSSRPWAPVVEERERRPRPPRVPRTRRALARSLRRVADAVQPACHWEAGQAAR